jgi:putative phosphoribosyl transferase
MNKIAARVGVSIPVGGVSLQGELTLPEQTVGMVVFVHGSGSSRKSSRNLYVAEVMHRAGLGSLLFDLLTSEEEQLDRFTRQYRFDITLLSQRLSLVVDWLTSYLQGRPLRLGLFGASTGAAAALNLAAARPGQIHALVSRGGRPDLAVAALPRVTCPTLFIVGGEDHHVLTLNRRAADMLCVTHLVQVVPGATHLFEEPGKLEQVADLASHWFLKYLGVAQSDRCSGE